MELWDIYDENGRPTGQTKLRGEPPAPGEYRLAASLWVLNSRGELLIQQRSAAKKTAPGLWSVTGGAVQAGEGSRAGCVREVREELGLAVDPNAIELLFRSVSKHIIFDDYILLADIDLASLVLQAEEVQAVRWATVAEIEAMIDAGAFLFKPSEWPKVKAYVSAHTGGTHP